MKHLKKYENFDDKWSVKRYGNAHVVYYDGEILGYDDRQIEEEENVTGILHNIEIVYNADDTDTETMTLYVVKEEMLKTIAEKLAEKIFRQGFLIRII